MNNKTMINLDNNLILKSENVEYDNKTLKECLDNMYNFSTEEKVVGKWVDGKPLYRKTLIFTDTINSGSLLEKHHGIKNVRFIFPDLSASFMLNTNGTGWPLPLTNYYGNFDNRVGLHIDETDIMMYADTGWGSGWTKVVTALYTKTTD